jgi:hypothetical protein
MRSTGRQSVYRGGTRAETAQADNADERHELGPPMRLGNMRAQFDCILRARFLSS